MGALTGTRIGAGDFLISASDPSRSADASLNRRHRGSRHSRLNRITSRGMVRHSVHFRHVPDAPTQRERHTTAYRHSAQSPGRFARPYSRQDHLYDAESSLRVARVVESHGSARARADGVPHSCQANTALLEDQVCADRIGQRLHPRADAAAAASSCTRTSPKSWPKRAAKSRGSAHPVDDRATPGHAGPTTGDRPIVASARLPSSGQLPEAPLRQAGAASTTSALLHSRFVSTTIRPGEVVVIAKHKGVVAEFRGDFVQTSCQRRYPVARTMTHHQPISAEMHEAAIVAVGNGRFTGFSPRSPATAA